MDWHHRGPNRNLLGTGAINKENKKKRESSRETVRTGMCTKKLQCSQQLLMWDAEGKKALVSELECRSTETLKEICVENRIPRTGAKYEIIANIVANIEGFKRQNTFLLKLKEKEAGDIIARYSLDVESCKSLQMAHDYVTEYLGREAMMERDLHRKFQILRGLSLGLFEQMRLALEGPGANLVNGEEGELAEDCNNVVIGMWMNFFSANFPSMSMDQVRYWIQELAKPNKCEDYGYPHVLAVVGDDIADLFDNLDIRRIILQGVDSVDQYGRKDPVERKREKMLKQDPINKLVCAKLKERAPEAAEKKEEEREEREDVRKMEREGGRECDIEALPIAVFPADSLP